jgi:hypothetical protein
VFLWLVLASPSNVAAELPLHERIDELIETPIDSIVAGPASDAEFLRRLYLDFVGRIPSRDQAIAFLNDSSADKRTALIDRLIASSDFPDRLVNVFDVMLMERMGENDEWRRYLRGAFSGNRPWHVMATEIASPDSENEATRGSAYFISKRLEKYGQNPVDYPGLVRDFGRMFLGVDLQCAQCHDHLFVDDYRQADYQGLFAFLGQTSIRRDLEFPAIAEKLVTAKVAYKSVFLMVEQQTGPRLPFGVEIDVPIFPKGEEYLQPPDGKTRFPGRPKFSPLAELGKRLPDHPLFRTNIANRLWWVMMGRGLVTPLDRHHGDNLASHPELLDLLGEELAKHDYDMRWFIRELALTRTYQRSSLIPASPKNLNASVALSTFQIAIEKPLSTEQFLFSVLQAVGDGATFAEVKEINEDGKANGDSVVDGQPASEKEPHGQRGSDALDERLAELTERFGRAFSGPPRLPEIDHQPSVKAALFLLNDDVLLGWLKPTDNNLVARMMKHDEPQMVADELYMSVLSRFPSDEEVTELADHLSNRSDERAIACGQLVWGLLASTGFCVNH